MGTRGIWELSLWLDFAIKLKLLLKNSLFFFLRLSIKEAELVKHELQFIHL